MCLKNPEKTTTIVKDLILAAKNSDDGLSFLSFPGVFISCTINYDLPFFQVENMDRVAFNDIYEPSMSRLLQLLEELK